VTPEEQVAQLTALLCEEHFLRTAAAVAQEIKDKASSETSVRLLVVSEERDSYRDENAKLRRRIMRLERDLGLAQRMARPKKVRA
jgi:hypothetical protein